MRRLLGVLSKVMLCVGLALVFTSAALADGITNSGDDLRTGWYPGAQVSPQSVADGTFGQLWSVPVDGQVYAQPLASTAPNGDETVIVATETNHIYGLDPQNGGSTRWSRYLGTPWNPGDLSCADINPSIGTTATPVIDPVTQTVYVTHKTYVSGSSGAAAWYLDAFDVMTGVERPGFPVNLSGTAANNPSQVFDPVTAQQRPGLLLMGGVVYAAFGGHCDAWPWSGWVFGVDAANGRPTDGHITARWVDATGDGAGIWQSGTGLMSDRAGSLLFVTGNGDSPANVPTPGNQPPSTFGESVVRLSVNADGSLSASDFFTPSNPQALDLYDSDFGSGGIVGLPGAQFGTSAVPRLAVAVGKQGYVYLLNRDNLGGLDEGSGQGDAVVQRLGSRGGVWGRAGVWPGDGGYIYVPTSTGMSGGGPLDVYRYGLSGNGSPSLTLAGSTPDAFGWGSGSPVITSSGTTSGSALVWIIWSANRQGANGQLRAYRPVPVGNQPQLVYSAPLGTVSNYSLPGVGDDGHLYVGTRDAHVIAFGAPVQPALAAAAPTFPATTTGHSDTETMTFTAERPVTISGLTSSSAQFVLGSPSQTLPATLTSGQTLTVPVTFAPTVAGPASGEVDAATNQGPVRVALTGSGLAPQAQLTATPPLLSMGGTAVGGHLDGTVTLSNTGNATLNIQKVSLPAAPFSITSVAPGATIPPGGSIGVQVSFDPGGDPTVSRDYTDALTITSDGGTKTIGLQASATPPGQLVISAGSLDFGGVDIGTTATGTFTVSNAGGTTVTIMKSKPPYGGAFAATTALPEGEQLAPGDTRTETVTFTPSAAGPVTGVWQITGNDGSGPQQVTFTGTGVDPTAVPAAGSGSAGSATGAAGAAGTGSGAVGSGAGSQLGVGGGLDIGGSPAGSPASPASPLGGPHAQAAPAAPVLGARTILLRALSTVRIRYTALVAATTRLELLRLVAGRRSGTRCLPVRPGASHGARCTLTEIVARLSRHDRPGVVHVALTTLIPANQLTAGEYLLRCTIHGVGGAARTFTLRLHVRGSHAR